MPPIDFATIRNQIASLKEDLGVERSNLIQAFQTLSVSPPYDTQKEMRELKLEEKRYDQDFREQQAILQSRGGKTREQTLQEFVLFFFYTGFVLVSISLATFLFVTTRDTMQVVKILGLMTFIGIIITGIIIRYA